MDKPKLTGEEINQLAEYCNVFIDGLNNHEALKVISDLRTYKSQADELKKTLEWYADEENWHYDKSGDGLIGDGGDHARQTLESLKEEDNS